VVIAQRGTPTEITFQNRLGNSADTNMLAYKVHTQRSLLQDKAVQYALNEVEFEVPHALIDAEVEARVRSLVGRLEKDDISIQDYLRITGQTEESFVAGIRDQADHALSTRILLESIAAVENWTVTDEDLLAYVERLLDGQPGNPQELVDAWKASGQVDSLTGDILRERALTSLVESATPVDADGNPVDLTPVVIDDGDAEEEPEVDSGAHDVDAPSGEGAADDESEE
jgi:trigger factor